MCDLQILADNEELPGWVSKFHHVFRRFGGFWLLLPLSVFLSGSPPGIKANYRGWGGLWEIMDHPIRAFGKGAPNLRVPVWDGHTPIFVPPNKDGDHRSFLCVKQVVSYSIDFES